MIREAIIQLLFWSAIGLGFFGAIAGANASDVDFSLGIFVAGMGLVGEISLLLLANLLVNEKRKEAEQNEF